MDETDLKQSLKTVVQTGAPSFLDFRLSSLILYLRLHSDVASHLLVDNMFMPSFALLEHHVHINITQGLELSDASEHRHHRHLVLHIVSKTLFIML